MLTALSFTEQQYNFVRQHLFKGRKEQGCFLFVTNTKRPSSIELDVKDIHIIGPGGWVYQSDCHLELDENEKVKVMLKARAYNYDLIECHSHRFGELAAFSPSDTYGLDEFIQYIWWKLPGKIYGAVVFTKSDVQGQIWLPKQVKSCLITEIRIRDDKGNTRILSRKPIKKTLFNILKRCWRD